MNEKILELEKSLFKYEYMSNRNYLNYIIDDKYVEIGKSGKIIDKITLINELSNFKKDRSIEIYNYSCEEISKNLFLVHYITRNKIINIYRTSIWKKNNNNIKLLFHQASKYNEDIELTKY